MPLRPPRRRKGKKRPNIFREPQPDSPPGDIIKRNSLQFEFEEGKRICLPVHQEGPNVLYDDRDQLNATVEEDAAIESRLESPLVQKTRPALPKEIDPEFNVKYNELLRGEYLRENLKIGHVPLAWSARLINLIKKVLVCFQSRWSPPSHHRV